MNTDPAPKPRASAVVTAFETHGRHYESRKVDCGKINCTKCGGVGYRHASHGPYWYLCYTYQGRWYRQYLGKTLDTAQFVTANGNLDMQALLAKRRHKRIHPAEDVHDAPGQLDALDPLEAGAPVDPPIPRYDPKDLKPPPGPDPRADVRKAIRDRIRAANARPGTIFSGQAPAIPDANEMHPLAPLSDPPPEDPADPGPVPRDPG